MRVSIVLMLEIVYVSLHMHGCDDGDKSVDHYMKGPRYRRDLPLAETSDPSNVKHGSLKANPVMAQKFTSCTGSGLGMYSWNHISWKTANAKMIRFLMERRDFACGDVYINVSDFSSPDSIPSPVNVISFIRNVRATGNRGVVYLTYGDINVNANGVLDGPARFARTFFDWFNSVPQQTLDEILPIGLSFDCEHVDLATIRSALTVAQNLKSSVLNSKLGNDPSKVVVQWVVEGALSPANTDTIMRLADSAIIMVYRNHEGSSPVIDPTGVDTLSTRFLDYMMTRQCEHCLDDVYAAEHYKAKIRLMIESDCECRDNCRKTSFCAFDTRQPGWGNNFANPVEYLTTTLSNTKRTLQARLTEVQQERLFGHRLTDDPADLSLFVVHNWEWFNCYFGDQSARDADWDPEAGGQNVSCKDYHTLANVCRERRQ